MTWRPIESAPKDGTEFLIATRSYFGGVVTVSWVAALRVPAFMDMESDTYDDATHWQPLPNPPECDSEEN